MSQLRFLGVLSRTDPSADRGSSKGRTPRLSATPAYPDSGASGLRVVTCDRDLWSDDHAAARSSSPPYARLDRPAIPERLFVIAFQLDSDVTRDRDAALAYTAVYRAVHARGGRHFEHDGASWRRLPQGVVVWRAESPNAELARVSFELMLAHLDLAAAAVVVTQGPAALHTQRVEDAAVPPEVRATAGQPQSLTCVT